MKLKNILLWAFIFLCVSNSFAISESDLRSSLNLDLSLRDIAMSFNNGENKHFPKDQFVIVIGSVANLKPQKIGAYLITKDDLIDSSNFIKLFKNPSTEFARAVVNKFSDRVKAALEKTEINNSTLNSLLRTLLRELSRIFRRQIFYVSGMEKKYSISKELLKLITQKQPADEMGYLNRLIFEMVYPNQIKKFQITLSLQDGEWISYDIVRTYKMDIIFEGLECYKIFNRRDLNRAVNEYIPLNSKAMIVASLINPILKDDEQIWQAKGYYIRRIP